MTQAEQPVQIISFPVEGMTCASCINRITRSLQKVGGVSDAVVNLATETATVRFDPSQATVAALGQAVEAARLRRFTARRIDAREAPLPAASLATS